MKKIQSAMKRKKALTPIRILQAVLITGLILLIILGIVFALFPDLSAQVFGYDLHHRLKAGDESDLALTLDLTRGGEIIGEGVHPSSQIPADQLQVSIRLYEKVQKPGREATIDYEVREMRRDKTGEGMKGKLGTEPFTMRVPARGGVTELQRTGMAKDEILQNSNLFQIGLAMWPLLPAGRLTDSTPGWSGAFTCKTVILGEEMDLTHRLDYKLNGFKHLNGRDYALLDFSGYIDPRPLKGELRVTGQGTMRGQALIDLQSTRNVFSNCLLVQDYLLELKGARYRFFEQQDIKFYRGKSPEEVTEELRGASPSPSPER